MYNSLDAAPNTHITDIKHTKTSEIYTKHFKLHKYKIITSINVRYCFQTSEDKENKKLIQKILSMNRCPKGDDRKNKH